MNTDGLHLKVGVIVLLCALVGIAVLIKVGKIKERFEARQIVDVTFENALGVKRGAPVLCSGVHVGTVREIIVERKPDFRAQAKGDGQSPFHVRMRLDVKESPERPITYDDVVTIYIPLVMGDPDVRIVPMGGQRLYHPGKPIPGVRVEIDTKALEDAADQGEIIVYGPNVMKGYHNLPEETAAVMTPDGGFRTGDRGRMDSDGFVYITGRIKEQYKLENGKYVVPAPLEEQLQLSPYILQVYIDGANQPYNVALVVPQRDAIEKWAKEQGMSGSYEQLLEKPATQRLIRGEIDRHSADFKGYERIREVTLIAEEFSTANGMLTPKLSLKRRVVAEKYGDLLAKLWT